MANYQLLKADIDAKVYENAKQKITGENLNSVLNAMVTTLGAEYQFAGVATIATNPGTPDAKVFYIANGKGTYTNLGGIEVTEDEVVVLYYDTEWHKVATGIASNSNLTALLTDIDNVKTDIDNVKTDIDNVKTDVDNEKDVVNAALEGKQNTIADLDAIRQGAQKGSTALQSESDPVYLADKPKLALKVEIPDVSGKVDKVTGKGLSSNDYTDADKLKLTGLENYDDTQIRELIGGKADKATTLAGYGIGDAYTRDEVGDALEGKQDKLVAGDNIAIVGNVISSTGGGGGGGGGISVDLSAYAKKEEVNAALAGKQDKISDLDAIREGAALGKTALQEHQDISKLATKEEVATKQDTISDLATIRSGAAKGATALQSYTETDPVYMADKPSLALKSEIPDISGKADKTLIVTETVCKSSYSIVSNRLTRLGTLASNVTLSLNTTSEEAGVVNVYDIIFTTPTTAPSITWPEGISWVGGSAPSIAGGKTYEVSIMDNLATYGEFSI